MINPFKSKKGLGRGLSSLIGDSDIKEVPKDKISISSIVPNKNQPRKLFEKESLEELSNSIKERGIIQPLIVRKSDDQDDKYELIAGERRWRALKHLKKRTVPAYVLDTKNSLDIMEMALVENIQREDLNPLEVAKGYQRLKDEFGYTQEAVAKSVGKPRSPVANSLRLLTLSPKIQDEIDKSFKPDFTKLITSFFLEAGIIKSGFSSKYF